MSMHKILGIIFSLLVILSSADAATIAYWRFEPGNLTLDSSGNGNTLVNAGAASSVDVPVNAGGSTGSALFDGTDIMSTVGTLDLTPYTQLTLEWYMKPASAGTVALWEQSANAFATAGGMGTYLNNTGPNQIQGFIQKNAGYFQYMTNAIPDGAASGAWHHYALEITAADLTSSGISLYVDGVLAGGYVTAGSPGTSVAFINQTLFIGARTGVAFPFTGNLDEFRISSGLLSPSEFIPEPSSAVMLALGAMILSRGRCRNQ